MLGTPALFATAYGNVGSSIYYALGLTAVYALGLTPLVFVIAGIVFAATAATYAEGTVRYPEAGGSSSFARHAFNELVSFAAGWAQMLVYIVTVATSAFFVPHYLSVFWGPLRENPADIVAGAIVIVVLVALNIVGVQEAARLSVTLAVVDFATQVLLVILGFVLVFSPEVIADNIHWGVAPTWSQLAIAIPVAMLAYTGVETVSNLAEEARDPSRTVPAAYKWVAGAVFAIYFTLPLVALSAMPVQMIDGELTTLLALPPEEGGYANDPILGVVDNLGVTGLALDGLQVYVGILAATILIVATNAGIIGASRITYSMATYRQMPEVFRRLHPRFKTPWLSLVVFAGVAPILVILPGNTTFVGTLYSFGATLSFTVAHASIVRLRMKPAEEEEPYRARPNLRLGAVDWPLFAVLGGIATGISFLVIVVQNAQTRWVGLAWMAAGLVGYVVYRRRVVHVGVSETAKAPPAFGPAIALEYRTIIIPVVAGRASAGGNAHGGPPFRRAPVDDRRHARDRRAARPPPKFRSSRAGGARRRAARRVARHRRPLRRPGRGARRPRPKRRSRDRRGGGAEKRGDHRHGRTATASPHAHERDLRQDGRLRAPQRPLSRDDRRRKESRSLMPPRVVVVFAVTLIALGIALAVQTVRVGGGVGVPARRALPRARRGSAVSPLEPRREELMARKLPVLQRVLGAPTLFSVAYGEIASSIYFALGIIAGHALGLTPEVLLLTGLLFLVVALSYAEGITAIPETGGAATLVRKAFNDFAGFCTGWVLFLDYLIVISLSALFLPHYLGGALEIEALQRHPWDVVVGVTTILAIAAVRLFRRPGLYTAGIGVAVLDLVTQLLVVVLGLALLFSPDALTGGSSSGRRRAGPSSPSPCRSRCSRSPAWRRSRISPRRRAGRASTSRAASSAPSAWSSPSTSPSPSSVSRPSPCREGRPSSAASGCSRRCWASRTCSARISRRSSPTPCASSSVSRAR